MFDDNDVCIVSMTVILVILALVVLITFGIVQNYNNKIICKVAGYDDYTNSGNVGYCYRNTGDGNRTLVPLSSIIGDK